MRITKTRLLPASLLATLFAAMSLGACGVQEASQMTKFADQMCACKDVDCAEKIFPEIEKFAKENEGKEVAAKAADKYNTEMLRIQGCYDKLHAEAAAAEAVKAQQEQPKPE